MIRPAAWRMALAQVAQGAIVGVVNAVSAASRGVAMAGETLATELGRTIHVLDRQLPCPCEGCSADRTKRAAQQGVAKGAN